MKSIMKRLMPRKLLQWRQKMLIAKYKNLSVEDMFSKIYSENWWGGEKGEIYSGTGTENANTEKYINAVIAFIREKQIKSILDIGCGDFKVMSRIVNAVDIEYTGADVAINVVEHNSKQYSNQKIKFIHLNAITGQLPKADLITIRQVLQHLSNEHISTILPKAIASSRFLLVTEHLPAYQNIQYNLDKAAGPDIRLYNDSGVFLEQPPFSITNIQPFLEYEEDFEVFGTVKKAVMKTSLIKGTA